MEISFTSISVPISSFKERETLSLTAISGLPNRANLFKKEDNFSKIVIIYLIIGMIRYIKESSPTPLIIVGF